MDKQYVSADQLLADSVALGIKIAESGYRPDLIAGVWRGGTPVGIVVQEVMEFLGCDSDHISIRTSSYTGIAEREGVTVEGMEYLKRTLSADSRLLLVDDVFDTGLSLDAVIRELHSIYDGNPPECRIATPYFKPDNNATERVPDYHLFETANWLVFPHEIIGLSEVEILTEKPLPHPLKERLISLREQEENK